MLNRIKTAWHVLIGDIDLDLMYSSHRAQMDSLSSQIDELQAEIEEKESMLQSVEVWSNDLEAFTQVTAPNNKAWGRVLRQLVWAKVNQSESLDDEELIGIMTDNGNTSGKHNALAQCISYLRTKKGYNIERKNNRYTL